MSTTQELTAATERYNRLLTAVEGLAAEWDRDADEHMNEFGQHMPASLSRLAEILLDTIAEATE